MLTSVDSSDWMAKYGIAFILSTSWHGMSSFISLILLLTMLFDSGVDWVLIAAASPFNSQHTHSAQQNEPLCNHKWLPVTSHTSSHHIDSFQTGFWPLLIMVLGSLWFWHLTWAQPAIVNPNLFNMLWSFLWCMAVNKQSILFHWIWENAISNTDRFYTVYV